jgi:hypothetical protein
MDAPRSATHVGDVLAVDVPPDLGGLPSREGSAVSAPLTESPVPTSMFDAVRKQNSAKRACQQ